MTDNTLALSNYAYNPSMKLPEGFTRDRELSNETTQVLVDSSGRPHLAFRGTKTFADIFPDIDIALNLRGHERFAKAVDLTKMAEEKYGKPAVLSGHSLGGTIAHHVSSKLGGREGKAYNPGKSLLGAPLGSTGKFSVERNEMDPISSGFKIDPNLRMSLALNLANAAVFHPLKVFK